MRSARSATRSCCVDAASHASGTAGGRYDVGAWERAEFVLFESDAARRIARIEIFADDRLADAIARLYERHAERSPEGPAREQAAATARTVAALLGPPDLEAWRACLAAGVEFDDRRILGFGSLRGREAGLPYLESLFETSESLSTRIDDVLALEPHAFLVRWTESGVAVGGGDFERVQLTLWILDAEGRVARRRVLRRRSRRRRAGALRRAHRRDTAGLPRAAACAPNAATRGFDRIRAAIAARDADALAELFDESLTVVHHPTRATYGRRGMLTTWRSTMRAERLEFRQEILASLGETLALDRHVVTVEGLAEDAPRGLRRVGVRRGLAARGGRARALDPPRRSSPRTASATRSCVSTSATRRSSPRAPSASARPRRSARRGRRLERADRSRSPGARVRAAISGSPITASSPPGTPRAASSSWSTSDASSISHRTLAARIDDVLALDVRRPDRARHLVRHVPRSGGAFENRLCILYRFGADGRTSRSRALRDGAGGPRRSRASTRSPAATRRRRWSTRSRTPPLARTACSSIASTRATGRPSKRSPLPISSSTSAAGCCTTPAAARCGSSSSASSSTCRRAASRRICARRAASVSRSPPPLRGRGGGRRRPARDGRSPGAARGRSRGPHRRDRALRPRRRRRRLRRARRALRSRPQRRRTGVPWLAFVHAIAAPRLGDGRGALQPAVRPSTITGASRYSERRTIPQPGRSCAARSSRSHPTRSIAAFTSAPLRGASSRLAGGRDRATEAASRSRKSPSSKWTRTARGRAWTCTSRSSSTRRSRVSRRWRGAVQKHPPSLSPTRRFDWSSAGCTSSGRRGTGMGSSR